MKALMAHQCRTIILIHSDDERMRVCVDYVIMLGVELFLVLAVGVDNIFVFAELPKSDSQYRHATSAH